MKSHVEEQILLWRQKINDIETVSENMEKELIRWTEQFNSQFESMSLTVKDLQDKNELLTRKNKSYEAKLAERNKDLDSCRKDIDELAKKLKLAEDRINVEKNVADAVSNEHLVTYEISLKEKDCEIEKLKTKVNYMTSVKLFKDQILEQISDLETRIKTKKKEEKILNKTKEENVEKQLEEMRDSIKKKASQSDLDKLSTKVNSFQQQLTSVPKVNHTTPSELNPNQGDEMMNQRKSGSPRNNKYNKRQEDDSLPRFNYGGEEMVLIMDSNMNYIEEKRFSRSTFKLKCGRAELLESKLKQFNLTEASHIFVGTGTNDIEQGDDAHSIFQHLKKTVSYLSSTYDAEVYLAQLPPTKMEGKSQVLEELNAFIKHDSPRNVNIVLHHEDLTTDDLFDAKHIKIKSLRKFVKNMKDKMRTVVGEPRHTNRRDDEESDEEARTSGWTPRYQRHNLPPNREAPNREASKREAPKREAPAQTQGQKLVGKILQTLQTSNESLITGLNSLASLL